MEHDIVELITAIEFARANFEHTTDSAVRCRFIRENKTDAFGQAYREDIAVFGTVQIHGVAQGTKITITVIGMNDNIDYQRKEIDAAMLAWARNRPSTRS